MATDARIYYQEDCDLSLLKGKKIRQDEKKITLKKPRLTVPEVKE